MSLGVHPRRPARTLACALFACALASGCSGNSKEEAEQIPSKATPANVTAEVTENITTLVNVSWTTEEASVGYVEYGPTEALGQNTPIGGDATVEHDQLLLGLKADTVYHYRVVTWDGADAAKSEIKNIRTGYLPPALPELETVGNGHDEFTIVPVLGVLQAVMVLDPEGQIVWYYIDESTVDTELESYRARLSKDGKGVVYNLANISGEPATDSSIVRVSFDGSQRTLTPIPLLAHDFVEHDDGTIGALVLEDREIDGEMVRGNRLIEVDPNGAETDIWSSWDCFDPAATANMEPSGWTFTNALDYDANDEAYYVGMRNFSSIARVSRETRECEWVLGFTASTLDFEQGAAQFQHQHQFQVFDVVGDDGTERPHLLVFDNEGSLRDESRVIEYELDLETNVASEVWRFVSTPPIITFVLGEPTRYPNGDTFINWSSAGQMERVTSAGETVWKLNSEVGAAFGFSSNAKTLYPPGADLP